MKKLTLIHTMIFLHLVWASALLAEVSPSSPFADHMVLQRDMAIPVWGTATPGEKVTVTLGNDQQSATTTDQGRWQVKLAKHAAGGPYTMTLEGQDRLTLSDVYVGEVWLCSGQSNMDMTVAEEDRYWCGVINEANEVAAADHPLIRMFDADFTPRTQVQTTVKGKWEVCSPETVGHFSAAAYFFGRELQQKYNVPIGLVVTAYGASTAEAWTSQPALEAVPQLKYLLDNYAKKRTDYKTALQALAPEDARARRRLRNPDTDQHSPYVLYNGMVAPLAPYAIRGAIWYQGESNGPSAKDYALIMETMIEDWRQAWGQGDFPFLYVQLANHQALVTDPIKDDPMVLVREGQLKNLSIPNTAMVVAIDNADDDPGNIHPKDKQTIGHRLALAARATVYGEDIPYSGPIYQGMTVEGKTIRLSFTHTHGGLKAQGEGLKGFAIAGADKAKAMLRARNLMRVM